MVRSFKYSEIAKIAEFMEECILHMGSDGPEALRMALEDAGVVVEADCNFTECDHGMGFAGGGGCPGDPADSECAEFTTEFSKEAKNG